MQKLTRIRLFLILLLATIVIFDSHAAPSIQSQINFIAKLQALPAVQRLQIHKPNHLLVRYRSNVVNVQTQSIASTSGALSTKSLGAKGPATNAASRWRLLTFPTTKNIDQARAALLKNINVEAVEYDYVAHGSALPNDPSLSLLWGLNNTGSSNGIAGVDIDAYRAWSLQIGDPNIIVAVIDSGIDYNHSDLRDNMWINSAELPNNGFDDDGNGFVDDYHGYNFYDTLHNGNPMDTHDHGTHVAGTIGATGSNGVGVVGVNWQVKLMALRWLGPDNRGYISAAIQSIYYAVDNGARILNNSWTADAYSQALDDAIKYTTSKNVLFVSIAGNGDASYKGYDIDTAPVYPAAFQAANMVSVAAMGRRGTLTSFSNWGKLTVDIAAPGIDIYSTVRNNRYSIFEGTSMAAPHVSGVAALILAQDPTLSAVALKGRLLNSVDKTVALSSKVRSGGYVNAYKAVSTQLVADPGGPYTTYVKRFQPFDASGSSGPAGATLTYTWDFGDGYRNVVGNPIYHAYTSPGNYRVQLIVSNGAQKSQIVATTVTVLSNPVSTTSPIANPGGPYSSTVGIAHQFDGSGSIDPNGGSLNYAWNFGDGSTGVGVKPFHTYSSANTYTVTLRVNSGSTYSTVASTSIVVSAASGNLIPIANPGGPYSTQVGIAQIFDGTGSSNPAGGVLNYSWTFGDGFGGGGQQTSHTYSSPGTYYVTLLVNNGSVFSAPVTTTVSVTSGSTSQPTASHGGPYSTYVGRYHVFDGNGSSDPNGRALTYTWDFGDGGKGTGVTPYHPYSTVGDFIVKLTVSNGLQTSTTVQTVITVKPLF